jgi:hypothetical protein
MIKSLLLAFLMLNQSETLGNKVDGLELPKPMIVKPDEGFVVLEAKCKGPVKWLLVSEGKVKYLENINNSVTVAVPKKGEVAVFAIGLVENKMTDFAVTTLTAEKPPAKPVTPPKKVEPELLNYKIRW